MTAGGTVRPERGWSLVYEGFEPAREGLREALCTLGNGFFATRGAVPEARADGVHYPGTYVAGLYNRLTTELAGRGVENEELVNVPNWLPLEFRVAGGPWFAVFEADLLGHRHELDLRAGLLLRELRWRDGRGRVTRCTQRRFVHMADPHLAGLETTFVAENWSGTLEVRSGLDGRVVNAGVARYRDLANRHLDVLGAGPAGEDAIWLQAGTNQSHVRVALAARTRLHLEDGTPVTAAARRLVAEGGFVAHELEVELDEGRPVTVEKIVALYTGRDHAISESGLEARDAVGRAGGFDDLLARHTGAWGRLWNRFGIALACNERPELVLHLHILHLLQVVSPHTADLDVGVPARGLHGEAYRGHVFWDELFIFPFLNFERPALTRALLAYRYRRLDAARRNAREAGYEGAMYPWQSGSNGREETQTVHLNPRSGRWLPDRSRLQRHVSIAVAYNVWQHCQVTGGLGYLLDQGAEMLVEIARFWASIATYDETLDRYEIRGVMGPDEYHDAYPDRDTPGIDNNAYTNVMAAWVLLRAREALELLPPHHRAELAGRLGLTREEIARWLAISAKLRVVFLDGGIISQFEGYDRLEELDWDAYRKRYGNIQRLDRILEAEGDNPNRYKVSKQADVLMLLYLLSADELRQLLAHLGYELEPDAIPRTIAYYLERTSHGSTLSAVVHAWVLARWDRKRAWEFFEQALESDVADVQGGTTAEGVHLGAMAGTVDIAQRCFSGMEARGDVLWFDPALPPEVPRLDYSVHYRDHRIDVAVTASRLRLAVSPSTVPPVRVGLRDRVVEVEPGGTVDLELEEAAPVG